VRIPPGTWLAERIVWFAELFDLEAVQPVLSVGPHSG
jgi:hypothetical protein